MKMATRRILLFPPESCSYEAIFCLLNLDPSRWPYRRDIVFLLRLLSVYNWARISPNEDHATQYCSSLTTRFVDARDHFPLIGANNKHQGTWDMDFFFIRFRAPVKIKSFQCNNDQIRIQNWRNPMDISSGYNFVLLNGTDCIWWMVQSPQLVRLRIEATEGGGRSSRETYAHG